MKKSTQNFCLSTLSVDYRLSINEMEQFCRNFPALKHFNLKTKGVRDLFDGNRWKVLANSFYTFNFHFDAQYRLVESILKSFCTPFWLEEKRWFVAYDDYSLFSIPHFAPNHIDISQPSRIYSTVPDHKFLYDYVNRITMKTTAIRHCHYFTGVKTLELECSISLKAIASIMNLSSIKYLKVLSLDVVLKSLPLEDLMPQIRELRVEKDLTVDRVERVHPYRFEQIHKLDISINAKQVDRIIEKLSIIFPNIQQLILRSPIHSKDTVVRLVDRFQYLGHLSFLIDIWFYRREGNFCRSLDHFAQYSRQLGKEKFIRRIYGSRIVDSPNDCVCIHYWIGEEVNYFDKVIYLFLCNSPLLVLQTFILDALVVEFKISLASIQTYSITYLLSFILP